MTDLYFRFIQFSLGLYEGTEFLDGTELKGFDWGAFYEAGGLVIADRYTTSNAVHQASKLPPEERTVFLNWLFELEYGKLGLPKPDLVLYLDMPTEITEKRG